MAFAALTGLGAEAEANNFPPTAILVHRIGPRMVPEVASTPTPRSVFTLANGVTIEVGMRLFLDCLNICLFKLYLYIEV